jgi:hypothetical protein
MSTQRIEERVARSIGRSSAEVFLRADFKAIGSYAQVGKALNSLTRKGRLIRLGYGVYAKAQPNELFGGLMPRKSLESLALETLKKLGVAVRLGRAAREYNEGSTQIPVHVCYDTGPRRISRTLQVGRQKVMFENNFDRTI